jgi:hypothetical protein
MDTQEASDNFESFRLELIESTEKMMEQENISPAAISDVFFVVNNRAAKKYEHSDVPSLKWQWWDVYREMWKLCMIYLSPRGHFLILSSGSACRIPS